jgi:hypothetical protein
VKRLGAVLAAVALVAVAFLVRDRDGGEEAASGADPDAPIVCADDLADVCRAAGLEVVEEVAGETADRLLAADGELGGAAWVTTSAWARLVLDERERLGHEPVVAVSGEALGHAPVVIGIWEDAREVLLGRCGGRLDWRCLAEEAGTELLDGNRVRTAVPPVGSATGLVLAASQAADLLGAGAYASNDFELGDFRVLFPRIAEGQVPSPLALMRSRGPGQLTAAGVVQAGTSSTASPFGSISVSAPGVGVQAELVVVVPAGTEVASEVSGPLTEALTAAGWAPGPSDRDRLPDGSVLAALRTLWAEAG